MNPLSTIIFDAEGVVLDTEPIWDESQREFLARRGVEYDRGALKHLIAGKSIQGGLEVMRDLYGFSGDTDELVAERKAIVEGLFSTRVQFIPGFLDFLDRVRSAGLPYCIATSMARSLMDLIDRELDVYEMFADRVFFVEDAGGKSKPDPAVFLLAARRMNTAPEVCLAIEDSPNGIQSAVRAGMTCAALTTTFQREKLGDAHMIFDSFAEISLDSMRPPVAG